VEKLTFFFDRCVGKRVPRALLALGTRCDFEERLKKIAKQRTEKLTK
jgi:hypothetical protein